MIAVNAKDQKIKIVCRHFYLFHFKLFCLIITVFYIYSIYHIVYYQYEKCWLQNLYTRVFFFPFLSFEEKKKQVSI